MKCNDKIAYESEKRAKQVRNTIGKSRNKKLRVYKCPHCFQWHLTSNITKYE